MALTQITRDNQIKPGAAFDWVTNDSSGKMSQTAVTGSRAVATDSNGLPIASTSTAAQLDLLQGLVGLVDGHIIYVDGSGNLASAGILSSNLFLADGSVDATADFNLGAFKITNLANPASAQDAATKAYVDAIASGLSPKGASRAATTGALPAVTYSGGGVGATLTETANGALPAQDGVTLVVNDRLLVKNQATALQNGIYTVTQVGDAGTPFILTRATDFDGSAGLGVVEGGSFTFVTNGTTQANTGWSVVWSGIVSVGTDPINFTQTSAAGTYLAGSGLDLTGNTFSISTDNSLIANAGNSNPSLVVQNSATGAIYTATDGLAIQLEATHPTLQIDGSNELGAKLNNAGAIITGASGLTVNVDGSTIDISANAIEVKNLGITAAKIANATITTTQIASATITGSNIASATITNTNLATGVFTAITGIGTQTQALNMGSNLINNVTDPASAQDAATKNYVDTTFLTSSNFVTREVPTGSINSSNVTFTLANTPTTGTECVYLNGLLQNAGGNDYSISTNTITFTTAPETGSVILVNYQK